MIKVQKGKRHRTVVRAGDWLYIKMHKNGRNRLVFCSLGREGCQLNWPAAQIDGDDKRIFPFHLLPIHKSKEHVQALVELLSPMLGLASRYSLGEIQELSPQKPGQGWKVQLRKAP